MNSKHFFNAISFLSAGFSIFAAGFSAGVYAHKIPTEAPPAHFTHKLISDKEACDGIDDDCNSIIDEGFNKHDDHFQYLRDPFDGATCGGTTPKLTCNVNDFPPACVPIDKICDGIDNDCVTVPEDLANEQTPRRAYKSSVGYLP